MKRDYLTEVMTDTRADRVPCEATVLRAIHVQNNLVNALRHIQRTANEASWEPAEQGRIRAVIDEIAAKALSEMR